jgi:hypothetical protein
MNVILSLITLFTTLVLFVLMALDIISIWWTLLAVPCFLGSVIFAVASE